MYKKLFNIMLKHIVFFKWMAGRRNQCQKITLQMLVVYKTFWTDSIGIVLMQT